jgi:hypothetical protein
MNLSTDNLGKPSNKKAKAVADFFLYSLPLYSTAVAIAADKLWSANTALIITIVINVVIITLKGLTKFTAEEEPIQQP